MSIISYLTNIRQRHPKLLSSHQPGSKDPACIIHSLGAAMLQASPEPFPLILPVQPACVLQAAQKTSVQKGMTSLGGGASCGAFAASAHRVMVASEPLTGRQYAARLAVVVVHCS